MAELTRDMLIKAATPTIETVQTPEGEIRIKRLCAADRDHYLSIIDGGKNMRNYKAELLVKCICGETGVRLLRDEDALALGQREPDFIDPIFAVAWRLNGLGEDDSGN